MTEITSKENKNEMEIEILYFTSPWCGPCRQQSPIIDELPKEYNVRKVDISLDEGMQEAVDNMVQQTPSVLVRYKYDATKDWKWYIDKLFNWYTSKEKIIDYIEKGIN